MAILNCWQQNISAKLSQRKKTIMYLKKWFKCKKKPTSIILTMTVSSYAINNKQTAKQQTVAFKREYNKLHREF